MNDKNLINNYLKNIYEFYIKNDFNSYCDKVLSYNIKIGDHRKDISKITEKVFTNILNDITNKGINFKYKNLENRYELYINTDTVAYKKYNVVLDIPVFIDNFDKISNIIINFLIANNVKCYISLYKLNINTLLKINVDDYYVANEIISYFVKNNELNNEVKSRTLAILYQRNLIGLYKELNTFNFKSFYIKNLYEYFSCVSDINQLDINDFEEYIYNRYNDEIYLNDKNNYYVLYKYICLINGKIKEKDLFELNKNMDFGGLDHSDYQLSIDSNNKIYFVNKLDKNLIINYGSDEYLNIMYSKFYENVIKKNNSNKYFDLFYGLYNSILSSNYKNINILLTLINDDMDNINKHMIIIASAFFAFKKMNFPLNQIYDILDNVLIKI